MHKNLIDEPLLSDKPLMISSAWYYMIERTLKQRGIDVSDLGFEGGSPSNYIENNEMPFDALKTYLAFAYSVIGDHEFIVDAAENLDLMEFGSVGIALGTAPDLGSMIDLYCDLAPCLGSPIRVVKKEGISNVEIWLLSASSDKINQSLTYLGLTLYCAVFMRLIRYTTGLNELPLTFKMPGWILPTHAIESLSKRYHCHIEVEGKVRRIVIDKKWLSAPLRLADADLYLYAKQKAYEQLSSMGEGSITAQVISVMGSLEPENISSQTVAERLHMSSRTLNRRLLAEGLNIRGVMERYKLEKALNLLKDSDNQITEVALELGFSDLSSFSRAFKKWSGISPKQFRADLITSSEAFN